MQSIYQTINPVCLLGHFLGFNGDDKKSTYLDTICNITVVTFNFDREVIITTGKFDIHEVQFKNIPVKNDSGVNKNSHSKVMNVTNGPCVALLETSQGYATSSPLNFPPSWATSCSSTDYGVGKTSERSKMTSSFQSLKSSFLCFLLSTPKTPPPRVGFHN